MDLDQPFRGGRSEKGEIVWRDVLLDLNITVHHAEIVPASLTLVWCGVVSQGQSALFFPPSESEGAKQRVTLSFCGRPLLLFVMCPCTAEGAPATDTRSCSGQAHPPNSHVA